MYEERVQERVPRIPGGGGPPPPAAGGSGGLTTFEPLPPLSPAPRTRILNSHELLRDELQSRLTLLRDLALATPVVRVAGLNRASISGSFVVVVRAEVDGEERVVGTESVLSRWQVQGCANCQLHLGVRSYIPLVGLSWGDSQPAIEVKLQTRRQAAGADPGVPTPNWRFGELRPE